MRFHKDPVLIVGDEQTAFSIAACLLQGEHPVTLATSQQSAALTALNMHLSGPSGNSVTALERDDFEIVEKVSHSLNFPLAILITAEDLELKRASLLQLENSLPAGALIAVNTESIPLSDIQQNARNPARIIGVNWVEPAHTTFFLEIISNETNPQDLVNDLSMIAKFAWQKDPYVLNKDMGIRSRMISAMVREAFYLLENDYVTVEDVDRACRNDPGYYLPFAGHCRYMDLMGTYIYGTVMKDLNPELSKDTHVPEFFTQIVEEGGEGLRSKRGFYVYKDEEVDKRREEFRKFSYEIQRIIAKYPFQYLKENKSARKKAVSNL